MYYLGSFSWYLLVQTFEYVEILDHWSSFLIWELLLHFTLSSFLRQLWNILHRHNLYKIKKITTSFDLYILYLYPPSKFKIFNTTVVFFFVWGINLFNIMKQWLTIEDWPENELTSTFGDLVSARAGMRCSFFIPQDYDGFIQS